MVVLARTMRKREGEVRRGPGARLVVIAVFQNGAADWEGAG